MEPSRRSYSHHFHSETWPSQLEISSQTCWWSKIASFLPGRTDNEIKNVWNTHLKKRLFPISSPSSSFSSISCTHDQPGGTDHAKNCAIVQEEVNSGFNESQESPSSSHLHGKCMHTKPELREVNELHEIQLLLDHDDFDDITSAFLQTNEMLFPEQPRDSLLHHHQTHISTEFHNTDGATQEETKTQSFDHPQRDIPCGFEETNGEFDLWSQLVESNSPTLSPNSDEEYNEWFNFMDNQTYFDDFALVGEVCL
ncbi:unnamed protein product [Thlaspi arvense]|uniref:Uncharacterized protein n=1 Tax=Thlaspi arvense TaxID=13288 RepID=A0AAU9R472_THLAR|nr:unnamed protein product [Thlaspi arvense]